MQFFTLFVLTHINQPLARLSGRDSSIIYKQTQNTLVNTLCTNDTECKFNLTTIPEVEAFGTFVYRFKQFRIRLQYEIPKNGLLKLDISSDPYIRDIPRNHTIAKVTLDKQEIAANLSTSCIPFDPKYCSEANQVKQCYQKVSFPSKCVAEAFCVSNSFDCVNDEL